VDALDRAAAVIFHLNRDERRASSLVVVAESSRSTAELIVECLENEGVTHVFGIPGEENIHLVEAISRSSIRYVLARHEQGASFMAETYGRLTGRAGVCSATLGPGAINLLLGTADATTNSTPLIALSAQVGMNRSFKESHQGVDLVAMFAPVVNRLHVYKVAVTPRTRAYMDAMMALPAWQNWSAQAQAETWIIDKYEIA